MELRGPCGCGLIPRLWLLIMPPSLSFGIGQIHTRDELSIRRIIRHYNSSLYCKFIIAKRAHRLKHAKRPGLLEGAVSRNSSELEQWELPPETQV